MTSRADNSRLCAIVEDPAAMAKFWSKVDREGDGECWEYNGNLNNGYGRFYHKGKATLAHRISYLDHYKEIPDGLVIDHICRTRACCNPSHLRAVSLRVNVLENSESLSAIFARRTHCPKGHELSGANLVPHRAGARICRICARARTAEWRAAGDSSVTNADREEAKLLIGQGDIMSVARGVAAIRYLGFINGEHLK